MTVEQPPLEEPDETNPQGTDLLGQKVDFPTIYNPSLLQGIPRQQHRKQFGFKDDELPFHGVDFWNAYEVSWLGQKGKPTSAMLEIMLPCNTPNIIESKSLKLYLGSFNQTHFKDVVDVIQTIESDLSVAARSPVVAQIVSFRQRDRVISYDLKGLLLDDLDVEVKEYTVKPELLEEPVRSGMAEALKETLYTHLFRSLCPVTGQPDWATIVVRYRGAPISHEGLLKYLLSYRNHQGFHEHCVESVYMDIMQKCSPEQLTVIAYYTRRGGIEINPFRSNFEQADSNNLRMSRQ